MKLVWIGIRATLVWIGIRDDNQLCHPELKPRLVTQGITFRIVTPGEDPVSIPS